MHKRTRGEARERENGRERMRRRLEGTRKKAAREREREKHALESDVANACLYLGAMPRRQMGQGVSGAHGVDGPRLQKLKPGTLFEVFVKGRMSMYLKCAKNTY